MKKIYLVILILFITISIAAVAFTLTIGNSGFFEDDDGDDDDDLLILSHSKKDPNPLAFSAMGILSRILISNYPTAQLILLGELIPSNFNFS